MGAHLTYITISKDNLQARLLYETTADDGVRIRMESVKNSINALDDNLDWHNLIENVKEILKSNGFRVF